MKKNGQHGRLFLLADLSQPRSRRLMTALDERLQARKPDWQLSVRDFADLDRPSLGALPADAMIVDSDQREQIVACRQTDRRLIATPATPIDQLGLAQCTIDQRLAGIAAADAMLRAGHRIFAWSGRGSGAESLLAAGFREEMVRADLAPDALQNDYPASQHDGNRAAAPTACLTDRAPADAENESPQPAKGIAIATIARADSRDDPSNRLVVEPSPHWLAAALVKWLDLADAPDSAELPGIPPRAFDDAEISRLPTAFTDPAIAAVSVFIDHQLGSGKPFNVEHLATAAAIPRRTLERRFREALGTSIHREITRRQVARAGRCLLQPGATPATAAAAAAYPTTRMLSINFSKFHGLSPRVFQRHVLAQFPDL